MSLLFCSISMLLVILASVLNDWCFRQGYLSAGVGGLKQGSARLHSGSCARTSSWSSLTSGRKISVFNQSWSSNSPSRAPICNVISHHLSKPSGYCSLNIRFLHFLPQFYCESYIQYNLLYLAKCDIVLKQVFHLYKVHNQDLWDQRKCYQLSCQHSNWQSGKVLVSSRSYQSAPGEHLRISKIDAY